MKKIHWLMMIVALPALFLACGGGETPADDTTDETVDETVEAAPEPITVTIENGLGSWDIWYGFCSLSDSDEWGEDRLGSDILADGESVSFELEAGTYDLMVEDVDGDTYALLEQEIDADFVWIVDLSDMDNTCAMDTEFEEGDAPVTIYNDLGDWTIWYVYGDRSDAAWGEDRLGSELLEPGEEFTFYVESGHSYDFKVQDGDDDTYTLWDIDIDEDGFYWEVTLDDLD